MWTAHRLKFGHPREDYKTGKKDTEEKCYLQGQGRNLRGRKIQENFYRVRTQKNKLNEIS